MASHKRKALRYCDEGLNHQQHGRVEEAKIAYQRAHKADKSLAAASNNLGFIIMARHITIWRSSMKSWENGQRLSPAFKRLPK
jgi:hypothetical protein